MHHLFGHCILSTPCLYLTPYPHPPTHSPGRHRHTGKWEAHLWDSEAPRKNPGNRGRTRGRQVYLGAYDTPEAAASAYDRAALAYWGEAAQLNVSRMRLTAAPSQQCPYRGDVVTFCACGRLHMCCRCQPSLKPELVAASVSSSPPAPLGCESDHIDVDPFTQC
jgi:hypothetical protein